MNRLVRCVCLAAVAATGCLALAQDSDRSNRDRRRTPVVEVYEKAREAVVNISTTRIERMRSLRYDSPLDMFFDSPRMRSEPRAVQSVGSGFVVHESGYIVTNTHVVAQGPDVRVIFVDGKTLLAKVIAADPEHDLAVIKVDSPTPLKHLPLGRSDDLMIGETVVAVGNPLGLQNTVTTGIISALNRDVRFSEDVIYRDLIQTDAAINPGNSGGPLLNINAELIGINTAIRGDAQNVGFAIPADSMWELLPSLLDIEHRERVNLGLHVSGREPTVMHVRPGSAADKAGLRPGDRIVRFNDHVVRDGIDYYAHLLAEKPGDTIQLTTERDRKQIGARIVLEIIPPPDGVKLARELLGLKLGAIPASIRRQFEIGDDVGVWVEDANRRGPAGQAGMKPGDIILRLNRVPVPTLDQVGLTLEQVGPNQDVVVEGVRLEADPPFRWTVTLRTQGTG